MRVGYSLDWLTPILYYWRMPCYLFTYHSYLSWMPDNERGFVRKGMGIQQASQELAEEYHRASAHPPVLFEHETQRFLIEVALDVCTRRDWRMHGAATETTHVHLVVSWKDESLWQDVRGKIKNIMSLELSNRASSTGRPWFVKKASRRRICDTDHFRYLVDVYLPQHRGWRWFEHKGWMSPGPPPPPGGC